MICLVIPVSGQPPYVELDGGSGVVPQDYGEVEVWLATGGWNADYGGRFAIAGRIEPRVRQATVARDDGRAVIASINDGWFLAWWPSESRPVRIDLHAADGELIATADLHGEYPPPPPCRVPIIGLDCFWE